MLLDRYYFNGKSDSDLVKFVLAALKSYSGDMNYGLVCYLSGPKK